MVNVIIPMYHARDTICDALNSLVAQTKKQFWVTLVQDCDGEDYSDIIEEYTRRGLHITLIQMEKNGGPGAARQAGIDKSDQFDYIMFMDADDMLFPRAIDRLYHTAKQSNADIGGSHMLQEITGTDGVFHDVNTTPVQWCHGKIYRTQYLKENNIRFHPDLRLNEDTYFNCIAWNCAKQQFRLPEITYLWRDNPNSLTRKAGEQAFLGQSYEQFFVAEISGLLEVLHKQYKTKAQGEMYIFTAQMLYALYSTMIQMYYWHISDEPVIPLLKKMGKDKVLLSQFENIQFWAAIDKEYHDSYIIKGKYVHPTHLSFYDWLIKYVVEDRPKIITLTQADEKE